MTVGYETFLQRTVLSSYSKILNVMREGKKRCMPQRKELFWQITNRQIIKLLMQKSNNDEILSTVDYSFSLNLS